LVLFFVLIQKEMVGQGPGKFKAGVEKNGKAGSEGIIGFYSQ
jgi:hypothetical protein